MVATPPTTLAGIPSGLLPNQLTQAIFAKSTETSALMALGRKVPLAMNATTAIPIPGAVPLAGFVSEGGRKPLGSSSVGFKTMQGKKLAVLIAVSEEIAMTNAAGLYEQLAADLPTSLARAFDYAGIHGKDLRTGGASPYADYLTATTHSVTLGTAAASAGGLWADLVAGEAEVIGADWDYTGTVADRRLRPTLKMQTDVNGRPIYLENAALGDPSQSNLALSGSLNGYPVAYTPAVSGKFRRQPSSTDSGLRAVGGDFSQVAFGVGMDIRVKVSTEGTYVDEDGGVHSAFQDNLVLLLCEAYYGLVISDTTAFVKFVEPTTP